LISFLSIIGCVDESCFGKSFSIPGYPRSTTLTTCFGIRG
jgi:hypothetical protein